MALDSADFLIDTNVLVYAFDASENRKRSRAIDVLEVLVASGRGALSTQVLGEFFSRTTRERRQILTPAQAAQEVENFAQIWPIADFSLSAVIDAIAVSRRHRINYFDALICATAKQNGIANILSEDGQDGRLLDGVRILNPMPQEFDLSLLA